MDLVVFIFLLFIVNMMILVIFIVFAGRSLLNNRKLYQLLDMLKAMQENDSDNRIGAFSKAINPNTIIYRQLRLGELELKVIWSKESPRV